MPADMNLIDRTVDIKESLSNVLTGRTALSRNVDTALVQSSVSAWPDPLCRRPIEQKLTR